MGILASVGITTIALMGAPLFIVMGLAALVAFQLSGEPVTAVPIELYRIADAPTLLTIPLFTFAGYMMAKVNLLRGFFDSLRVYLDGCLVE